MAKKSIGGFSSLFLLEKKEIGNRPSWREVSSKDTSTKIYWSQWDALVMENEILYKRWELPSLRSTVLQIVVPSEQIIQILKKAHDSPSGGHFGVNRTLGKIKNNFTGPPVSRMWKTGVGHARSASRRRVLRTRESL